VGSGAGTPNCGKGPGYLAENWDALTSALEAAAKRNDGRSPGGRRASFSDDSEGSGSRRGRRASFSDEEAGAGEEAKKDPAKAKKFAEKRHNHYDEYARLQVRARPGSLMQCPCP
jgi:hypothetical protein